MKDVERFNCSPIELVLSRSIPSHSQFESLFRDHIVCIWYCFYRYWCPKKTQVPASAESSACIMVKILEMGYCCGRRSKTEGSNPTDDMVGHVVTAQQEGIRTVRSCNSCEFSSDPDACICLITWNMNGQVCYVLFWWCSWVNISHSSIIKSLLKGVSAGCFQRIAFISPIAFRKIGHGQF